MTRDYAWLGESSAKKKKEVRLLLLLLLQLFFCFVFFFFLHFFSFSLFPFRATKTLSPLLQLFFLPQHIIRGQGSWKRVLYTFVSVSLFLHQSRRLAGKELAPFVLFLSSSFIENLTWSIFHFLLLLHIWFWHTVVIGIVSFELLFFLFSAKAVLYLYVWYLPTGLSLAIIINHL